MVDTEERQRRGPSTLCTGPGHNVNPQGRRNACVQASWADELADETGYPFVEADFRWTAADDPTPWHRVYEVKKQIWGDRRFSGMDPTRAMLQSQGMPAIIPRGMDGIIDELKAAGDGAGGFFIIFRQDNTAHMFRAKNFGGAVRFREPALDTGGSFNFIPGLNGGPLTQAWCYRTTGQDLLPPGPAP